MNMGNIDTLYMNTLLLINRMMLDEWSLLIYSGFDKENGHEYYRLGIRESINDIIKRIRNVFIKNGYKREYEILNNLSCDHSDELEEIRKTFRNRIETKLLNKMSYHFIKPFVYMTIVYIFCEAGRVMSERTKIMPMYVSLSNMINEYSDNIGIELFQGKGSISDIINDDDYELLYNRMFQISKTLK